MNKAVALFSCVLAFLLLLPSAPVDASPATMDVHFEVDTTIPDDVTQPTYGPFTATGPAVDAGLICPSGDTIDISIWPSGYRAVQGINFHDLKRFTCADGSGEFFVKLEARSDWNGCSFNWVIIDGTGRYEIRGSGHGGCYYDKPNVDVFDVYDGFIVSHE